MTSVSQETFDLLVRRFETLEASHSQTRGIMNKANEELQERIKAVSSGAQESIKDLRHVLDVTCGILQAKVDTLSSLTTSARNSGDKSLIDKKGLGKPNIFNSKNNHDWPHWAFKFRNYITNSGFPKGRVCLD